MELVAARIPRITVRGAGLDLDPVTFPELTRGALHLDHALTRKRLPGLGEVLMEMGIHPPRSGREGALELHRVAAPLGDLDPGPGPRAGVPLADLEHGRTLSGV